MFEDIKGKWNEGCTGRKEGRSPRQRRMLAEQRPEVYVDRNRVAIKSYLSYCYLRRNSPQVSRNEHARIVRSATARRPTAEAELPGRLFVRTHSRDLCTPLYTDRIYFNGRISARMHVPISHGNDATNPLRTSCKR